MRICKFTNVAKLCVCLAVFALCMCIGQATATPIYFSGTGHYYDLVYHQEPVSWHEAKTEAESITYLGTPGYLATITSQAENDFIVSSLLNEATAAAFWLGGFQPNQDPAPDGNWEWITGEAWSYTNWAAGEPSDGGDYPYEDVVEILGPPSTAPTGTWNDVYTGPLEGRGSYVIEYPIPEPVTLVVLAASGLLLIVRKRTN